MSNKVSYVTKEGLKKLQEELERLQNVERPKISKAIGEAIEKGDISENAEKNAETSAENIEEKEADKKDSEDKKEEKKDDLKDQIEAKDAEIADWKDKYQRLMAEFENARKRMSKESTQRYDMGAMGVLEKLLPVIDNFERGLESVTDDEKDSAFVQGIQQIYKQLMAVMEDLGVTPMDAEGKEFDANLHNAVMHVEDEELGENVVAEELQKGYMYKESVLRHSMVKVAN